VITRWPVFERHRVFEELRHTERPFMQWNAALPAVVIGTAAAVVSAMALWVVGLSPWWSVLLFPVPTLVVYVRMAKDRTGGLSELEKLRLAWNYRYSQPREVLGLQENTEPTDFTLDVIFWLPPGPTTVSGATQ